MEKITLMPASEFMNAPLIYPFIKQKSLVKIAQNNCYTIKPS